MSDTLQRSQVSAKPKDALPPKAASTGTAAQARRGPLAEAVRSGPLLGLPTTEPNLKQAAWLRP